MTIGRPLPPLSNQLWGPFTIDRFADSKNTKLKRFNSKFLCPSTEGVDAFTVSWKSENNFIVPPVYLAGKAIKHLEYYGARGVLVVPYWSSAAFWLYLVESKNRFKPFVKDCLLFEDKNGCVIQGPNKNCFIGSPNFQSSILAIRMDFRL